MSEARDSESHARDGRWEVAFTILIFTALAVPWSAALPQRYGDLDIDGSPTAADVVLLVNHLHGTPALSPEMVPYADADQDSDVDADDVNWIVNSALGMVGLWGTEQQARFTGATCTLLEGTQDAEIVIELSNYAPGTSVRLEVVPEGTTATEGVDFSPIPASVEVNIDHAVIPISIPDDAEREGCETIEIQITAVSGFDLILPTRHVVLIEDNDCLWQGVLSFDEGAFNDCLTFDMVILNQGGVLSGLLLGDTEPSFPSGQWPMTVTFTDTVFEAEVSGLPVPGSELFFGMELARGLTLIASPESVGSTDDSEIFGHFEETFSSPLAPHLDCTVTGTFGLVQTADPQPTIAPEEQDVVTGASSRRHPTRFPSITPVSLSRGVAARPPVRRPHVPQSVQDATMAVRGNWTNELRPGGLFPPSPEGVLLTAGGSVDEASAAPGSPSYRLTRSSIGQTVGHSMPLPNLAESTLTQVGELLYYDPSSTYAPDFSDGIPAFRYLALLYGIDVPASGEATLRAQFEDMGDHWRSTERSVAQEAECLLRDALKHQPLSRELRHALLDLICDRARAELILARSQRTEVIRQRLEPPPPGGLVIDDEITAFEDLAGPHDSALAPFGELLRDRMGVLVSGFDPSEAAAEPPLGCYLFQREEPSRSQYAARYLEGGALTPVIAGEEPLFTGHKDLVVLFEVLTDQAQSAVELSRLYAMRATGSDLDDAEALIRETLQETRAIGLVLLALFPDCESAAGEASGLTGAITAWRAALTELQGTHEFLHGEANMLGFTEDFLMLVQNYDDSTFDTFDSLSAYIEGTTTAPLTRARRLYDDAVASYDAYRGYEDQLAFHHDRLFIPRDNRLREITGVRYPQALTTDPVLNEGSEMNIQWLSVQVAQNHIRRNAQELENLHGRIDNILALWAAREAIDADLRDLHLDYGTRRSSVQEKIGAIEAAQAFANEMCARADGVTVGIPKGFSVSGGVAWHTVNAFLQAGAEVGKGFLRGDLESMAGEEQAGVVMLQGRLASAELQREINDILLEMRITAIDSVEAALLMAQEQARLTALHDEANDILAQMLRESEDLSRRYFADPIHQLRYQHAVLEANAAFQSAQRWVFFMSRALQFKYPYGTLWSHTFGGRSFDAGSVLRVRNAPELEELVAAMREYDALTSFTNTRVYLVSRFSLRDDILGLWRASDPIGEFRAALRGLEEVIDTDNREIVFPFGTVRRPPGYNVFHPDNFADKIEEILVRLPGSHTVPRDTVSGDLSYGGTAFMRPVESSTAVPSDWITSWWIYRDDRWQQRDTLEVTIDVRLVPSSEAGIQPQPGDFNIAQFGERSVAATEWTLRIDTMAQGQALIHIDEIDDIEVWLRHRAFDR
ncbi:hypothetical protein JXA47_13850 [Candidatus Sumerlaeota bacterium]|nr:hypothetical protein [Candidatus Sumerlaeota bacterium]